MTQDEIIEMAREAGCGHEALDLHWVCPENLEAFAKLVAAKEREFWIEQGKVDVEEAIRDERESCANLCDKKAEEWADENERPDYGYGEAIRARGEA